MSNTHEFAQVPHQIGYFDKNCGFTSCFNEFKHSLVYMCMDCNGKQTDFPSIDVILVDLNSITESLNIGTILKTFNCCPHCPLSGIQVQLGFFPGLSTFEQKISFSNNMLNWYRFLNLNSGISLQSFIESYIGKLCNNLRL